MTSLVLDDDEMDDDIDVNDPKYPWFQRPAPSISVTFTLAGVLLIATLAVYHQRVEKLKIKFGREFRGSLRVCALISKYMDNEDPIFSIFRLCTKSLIFLGALQIDYNLGFVIMLGLLVVESSLDTIRVLLAYRNCKTLRDATITSEDEAHDMHVTTKLEPTNVYEDLTRPRSIAVMVFVVQSSLIGIVMYDSYRTTTRTCFDGTEGCPMLSSLGSYCLYFLGTFMACVFYVGPMNSYGKKEQNPIFWLKLFLMSKQTSASVSWQDSASDQIKTIRLERDDWRIWLRFVMSFLVNGVAFHYLLHVLPIQIASKSSILGVVYSAVGMIYLVDLDDTTGNTMTLVPHRQGKHLSSKDKDYGGMEHGNGLVDEKKLDEEKQRIIDEAMEDIKAKFEALARGLRSETASSTRIKSITHALLLSTQPRKASQYDANDTHNRNNEETPLLDV